MSSTPIGIAEALAQPFDAIIDVRSPSEFAEDHLPGAVNWPVLDDEQRRIVGTMYKQISAFEARKVGAAMVARNIAAHIDREVANMPKGWKPLVYCWRGGQRSGAMAWFLGQIGFNSRQLTGGYKAFRAQVRHDLETLPITARLRVLCGRTGSGKTRLLQALGQQGGQILDLEGLACHRGSVLGGLPDQPQPGQKRFETLIWQALRGLDASKPLYLESESRKIGQLRVPEQLHQAMREQGQCWWVDMPEPARVRLLLEDYGHFADDVDGFCAKLQALTELRGKETVARWQQAARDGDWAGLFAELMRLHYDPGYERSLRNSYRQLDHAPVLALEDGGSASLVRAAQALLHSV
ncbi:tRNA 2-selenouridine(34) synthase MnmH [Roseateles toxinivorans]|uniref:tRNA 2-selenouridine synthase n=1 Tax=Roseateles toxinivorans TaxID=270368 RepID=A0A4R6QP78_9BURK|nr:tRNA 2-selenouridine(34) synthase MnmH [Roseateles toxinivorans]TDP64301.1 tRNA 2-selenouridine synthase [Roseateles toxinivorans]